MELNLKRPIIFFDLETTGIDIARDRIVEISMVKVMPDGEEIVRTRRINPGMPIPAEATAIHGITDEDVKDCPLFPQIAKSLAQFIEGCDFGGFNSNRFDLPMLVEEFMRAGVAANCLGVTSAKTGKKYSLCGATAMAGANRCALPCADRIIRCGSGDVQPRQTNRLY